MRSYVAVSGTKRFIGSERDCFAVALEWVASNHTRVAKVFRVRRDQGSGRVVAEITCAGIRLISHGRQVPRKRLSG